MRNSAALYTPATGSDGRSRLQSTQTGRSQHGPKSYLESTVSIEPSAGTTRLAHSPFPTVYGKKPRLLEHGGRPEVESAEMLIPALHKGYLCPGLTVSCHMGGRGREGTEPEG